MSTTHIIPTRFPLGQVVATSALISTLESAGQEPQQAILDVLGWHGAGEWGKLGDEDKRANEYALAHGERILSRYELGDDDSGEISVYVITEWDRSYTTVMRVQDY